MNNSHWQKLNTVTTLSKLVALAVFVGAPVLCFWIGYNNGFATGYAVAQSEAAAKVDLLQKPITKSGLNSDNTLLVPATDTGAQDQERSSACSFVAKSGAFGNEKITNFDKANLCDYFKANKGENSAWNKITLLGTEGDYLEAGNQVPCLFNVADPQIKVQFCAGDLPRCELVDGLGITNLIPSCFESAISKERKTK